MITFKKTIYAALIACLAVGSSSFGMEKKIDYKSALEMLESLQEKLKLYQICHTVEKRKEMIEIVNQTDKSTIEMVYHFLKNYNLVDIFLLGPTQSKLILFYTHYLKQIDKNVKNPINSGEKTIIDQHFHSFFNNLLSYEDSLSRWSDVHGFKIFSKDVCAVLGNAKKREKLETFKNRYTLWHAEPSNKYIPSQFCKKIMELVYGKKIKNYYPLDFKKLSEIPGQKLLEKYMKVDYSKHEFNEDDIRLLFMNLSPITGSSYSVKFKGSGSSTLWFFLNNTTGNGDYKFDVYTVFYNFDLENLYIKWKDKIEALVKRAPQSEFGTLLAVSFTASQIEKSTYLARIKGLQHPGIVINGKKTTNLATIIDSLREKMPTNDEKACDVNEICSPLTGGQNGLLNPWNEGVRIYEYTVNDMRAWLKDLDELWEKISKDCENNKRVKKIFKKERKFIQKEGWIPSEEITETVNETLPFIKSNL